MWRIKEILKLGGAAILAAIIIAVGLPVPARANPASAPSLVISQLKITSSSGQFITLYNATDTVLDMSKYQLQYFNNYDLGKSTSSKLISLSGTVPPHGYFMINDSLFTLCYQLTVDSLSLGLSSTSGLVEILAFEQPSPGGSVIPVLQDYVGWSKTAASGPQTLPANTNAFLQRQPVNAANNPSVSVPGAGSWQTVQPDAANPCNLVGGNGLSPVSTGLNQLLLGSEPPATILAAEDNGSGTAALTAVMPAADIGLMAPKVTEILPNPNGTGNDATEEFIELYNPNPVSFDLSGFGLQVGSTTLRTYIFAAGTSLPAGGFKAFYSAITGLSLSNSGSQVKLLDPFGNSIAAAEAYSTAKDGQAWALANGKWYWTTKLTPDAANIINQPPGKKTAVKSSSSKKPASKAAAKVKTSKTGGAPANQIYEEEPTVTPIHLRALALVAAAALLYGVYEYRADLANRVYQLRRYLESRRENRA